MHGPGSFHLHNNQGLPPCLQVEVVTPEEHMGDVIGDFNTRRGIVGEFLDKHGGLKLLKAEVPLAEMFQYVSSLRGMTKGELKLWFRRSGLASCFSMAAWKKHVGSTLRGMTQPECKMRSGSSALGG